MGILAARASEHYMHTQCLWRLKEHIGYLGTAVTARYYPPSGVPRINLGSSERAASALKWSISPAFCTVIKKTKDFQS